MADVLDVITYAKFRNEIFRGYNYTGGQSQSNEKGQILNLRGSETPERISMKLGIYNRVAGMTTHAYPYGAATMWVIGANT